MFLFDWVPILGRVLVRFSSLSFTLSCLAPPPPSQQNPHKLRKKKWGGTLSHSMRKQKLGNEWVSELHRHISPTTTTPRYNSDQQYSYIVAQQCGTRVPETDLLHVSGMQYLRALFPMDDEWAKAKWLERKRRRKKVKSFVCLLFYIPYQGSRVTIRYVETKESPIDKPEGCAGKKERNGQTHTHTRGKEKKKGSKIWVWTKQIPGNLFFLSFFFSLFLLWVVNLWGNVFP